MTRRPRHTIDRTVLHPSDAAFFVRLGEAAEAIGAAGFPRTLLRLLGTLISHDSAWIIRYSPNLAPEVLHTDGVRAPVVAWYCDTYSAFDPFARAWRLRPEPGVVTLGRALARAQAPSPDGDIYVMTFQLMAGFADELAVILPMPGGSGLALFLQRNEALFTAEEEAVARLVCPALDGLHAAHVARLLLQLKSLADHPALRPELASVIVDRSFRALHANGRWLEAERRESGLLTWAAACVGDEPRPSMDRSGRHVRVESLGASFPLAPGGWMVVLEEEADRTDASAADAERALASSRLPPITARERDILRLILQGRTTGEIAQRLGIGKGTVKNYRLRLYRKANVGSERALVALFKPLLGELAPPEPVNPGC